MALKVTQAKKGKGSTVKKNTRGKKSSKPKVTSTFKKAIQAYVTQKGRNDMAFQARLDMKDKNIDDCVNYILNKVKASGMNGFADEEIYGMAAHYYDEDKVDVGKKVHASTVIVNHTAGKKKDPKMVAKKGKDDAENQTSLF